MPAARWMSAGLAVALLGGCSLISSPTPGSRAEVGQVSVRYPKGWAVLAAADRPTGWDWAAQDQAGTAQVAMDGDYSALDVDFTVASLLAGAQVGSYPDFALAERSAVDVDGARVDFGYQVADVDYQAAWVVARGDGSRTVVVQVSGRKPLSSDLVTATIEGMEVR